MPGWLKWFAFWLPKEPVTYPASQVGAVGIQERYWRNLVDLKFSEFYIAAQLRSSEAWVIRIDVFLALTSTGSVASWAIWKQHDILWATIIAASQVVVVVKRLMPFQKRIAPLRAAGFAAEEIFLKAEKAWHEVSEGHLTEGEINDLLFDLKTDSAKAWKKNAGEISLPSTSRLRRIADDLTAEYFQRHYHQQVTIEP